MLSPRKLLPDPKLIGSKEIPFSGSVSPRHRESPSVSTASGEHEEVGTRCPLCSMLELRLVASTRLTPPLFRGETAKFLHSQPRLQPAVTLGCCPAWTASLEVILGGFRTSSYFTDKTDGLGWLFPASCCEYRCDRWRHSSCVLTLREKLGDLLMWSHQNNTSNCLLPDVSPENNKLQIRLSVTPSGM